MRIRQIPSRLKSKERDSSNLSTGLTKVILVTHMQKARGRESSERASVVLPCRTGRRWWSAAAAAVAALPLARTDNGLSAARARPSVWATIYAARKSLEHPSP